jgi:hypothetical protein
MRRFWPSAFFLIILLPSLALVPNLSKAETPEWTFMVYMGADSSLEEFGIDDFNEMAAVGSTNEVNIIVQFDRTPNYVADEGDWDTTKRYLVAPGMRPNAASALEDLGEVNMGDPLTLVNFTLWGIQNYPADRYFLNLWGHGLGWRGVVQDESSSSDYLKLDELKWAFEAILANNSGKKIDLLGADACRMTTEMNYQLKDYVDFFVGSQKDEPEPGWPYNLLLQNLTSDPYMGPAELGRTIVDTYVESYIGNTGLAVALSVIDASRLEHLGEDIRRFVEQARSALPMYVEDFKTARIGTERYEGDSVYDLHDLAYRLEQTVLYSTPAPRRLLSQVYGLKETVVATVSYERNWDNPVASVRTTNAHGMSIWYPLIISDASYFDLDLSEVTGWDDYLVDFKAAVNGEIPDPETPLGIDMTFSDTDSNGLNDTVRLELTSPKNATLEIDISFFGLPTGDSSPLYVYLPAGIPRYENIALSEEISTDFDFYLMNETKVWMNVSFYRNVVLPGYLVSGTVRDGSGVDLVAAIVMIENLDSGGMVVAHSNASGYSARITPANDGDRIRVTAVYYDWSATATFEIDLPSEGKVMDFVLGPGTSSDEFMFRVLVVLTIIEAIIIVALLLFLLRFRKKPVEESGEELLKELGME